MTLEVRPLANDFGACLVGLDLSQPLFAEEIESIRHAWTKHRFVYFPDQPLSHLALESFTQAFGDFGEDPYVEPLDSNRHILEVKQEADETCLPFGSSWHSDWSFQAKPPSATLLHAKIVPPIGGQTCFADGIAAYRALPEETKEQVNGLVAIHSARRAYSHEGFANGGGDKRSMSITPSDSAWSTQYHPLVRIHPETGEKALWINPVYTIGIRGMVDTIARELLDRLFKHLTEDRFVYTHRWQPDMLTMWDNRSVIHRALGGYDGHRRLMHRTVVAGCAPF